MSVRRSGRPGRAEAAELAGSILAAAKTAFLERGFSGASIAGIALAAGTSKQTVHARFGSKEKLFIAVSDALLSGRFSEAPPEGLPLRDTLLRVAVEALDAMLDPSMVRLSSIIAGEAGRFPQLAQLADDDATFPGRKLMLQVICDGVANGELRCADPRAAMLMLQDMVLATPLRVATSGRATFDHEARRSWATQAVDLFLQGMLAR